MVCIYLQRREGDGVGGSSRFGWCVPVVVAVLKWGC